jgi:hypothetical protein
MAVTGVGQQPITRLRRGLRPTQRDLCKVNGGTSSERHRQKNSSHSLFISKFRPCETRQRVFEFPGCMRLEQSVAGPVNRTPMKSEPLTDRISRVRTSIVAWAAVRLATNGKSIADG